MDHLTEAQRFALAMQGIEMLSYGHGKTLQEAIEEEYDVHLNAEVCGALDELTDELKLAHPGDDTEALGSADETPIHRIIAETQATGGSVFMAATPNQQKARVAFDMGRDGPDDESDNLFVQIETDNDTPVSVAYDRCEKLFGWRRLKEINLHKLYEYDISAELYNDLTEDMGIADAADHGDEDAQKTIERAPPTPPAQQEINLSVSNKRSEQEWWQVKSIEETLRDGESLSVSTSSWSGDGFHNIDRLILFPSNSERNISDFYWLGGTYGQNSQVALANCNVGVYEYLDGLAGVYHVDSFAEAAWRLPVETNDGAVSITQARENLVFHMVSSEAKPHFEAVADDVVKVLPDFFDNASCYTDDWGGPAADSLIYAPVTLEEAFEFAPAMRESNVQVIWGDEKPHFLGSNHRTYHKNDLWLYAAARLDQWTFDTPVMQAIMSLHMGNHEQLTDRGYALVGTLAERHDAGKPPVDT